MVKFGHAVPVRASRDVDVMAKAADDILARIGRLSVLLRPGNPADG